MSKRKRILLLSRYSQGVLSDAAHPLVREVLDKGHFLARDVNDNFDLVVVVDFSRHFLKTIKDSRKKGLKVVLVKLEPTATLPIHRYQNPKLLFDDVISVGRPTSNSSPIPWPVEWNTEFHSRRNRLNLGVAINAYKWSFDPESLYYLRNQAFSQLSRLHVFGNDWGNAKFKKIEKVSKELALTISSGRVPSLSGLSYCLMEPDNYMGPASEKLETLANYKVSLVIENSRGYISEKLIDALLAGTIPVYVGSNPAQFGIPPELYFQADESISSIRDSWDTALNTKATEFYETLALWLESEVARMQWKREFVWSRILLRCLES